MKSKRREDMKITNVKEWINDPYIKCKGNFRGYANEFAILNHARFNKSSKSFSIPCEDESIQYKFLFGKEGTILTRWLHDLKTYPYKGAPQLSIEQVMEKKMVTFAVKRYEAHNLYHTVCEWYNIYVISELLNIKPETVDILFMDDRPRGLMDDTWDTLFAQIYRYSNLTEKTIFETIVWNAIGYESPLNFHEIRTMPFINQFYKFFLNRFNIKTGKRLDCKNLRVTIIWRRDYMSHPERKEETGGLIHRKFQNENEILAEISAIFNGHTINELVLEQISMKQQLQIISQTDILFGMHGAGMAHALFLPKHAAVFETFPNYWGFLRHFKSFSRWRGIKYLGWQNKSPENEFENFNTRIPVDVIRSHMVKLKEYLCPTYTEIVKK
ncbi:hypothetical protein ACF0H5_010305 [Mactra antiquata]